MPLNLLGSEAKGPVTAPVTLPTIVLPPDDIEYEIKEAAARVSQQRTIRLGRDAWHLTQKSASFENWKLIGRALRVGRNVAVRASGRHYTRSG
jgi:hypothetical protein